MSVRSSSAELLVCKDRSMDAVDEVWNRAAMAGGGPAARGGDASLASVLSVHSMAMSGGLLNAVEQANPDQLEAAEAGYRWLRLDTAADVVAMVRREIETGALDDEDRADALEARADDDYGRVVPTDQALLDAFRTRWSEDPDAFAPI
jgi:hypothetical protein